MKSKWTTSCLVCVAVMACGAPNARSQVSTEQLLLDEIRALRGEIKELTDRLDQVEKKLAEPEAEAAVPLNRAWQDDWQEVRADPKVLAEIEGEITPELTEPEAKDLISRIAVATIDQNHFSPEDTQTRLLVRIGRLHPPAVIAAVSMPSLVHHVEYAVPRINWEQHKALVLEHLPEAPALVAVVNRHGWGPDASETLLQGLRRNQDLPLEWFQAALMVAGPADQDALAAYLASAGSWVIHDAYTALRLTRGFDVDEVVAQAWRQSRFNRFEGRLPVALIAVHHGQADAWPVLFEALPDQEGDDDRHFGFFRNDPSPRSVIVSLTPARGSNTELKAWFKAHGESLRFDADGGKWVVAGAVAN